MSFQYVPYAATALPAPQLDGKLRLFPLSDLHLPKPASALFLANRAYLERMDQVVFLGDMVAAYGTDEEYQAVHNFVQVMDRPYQVVSGNHEWFFTVFEETSGLYAQVWTESGLEERRAQLAKFQKFWGLGNLWRAESHPLGHFVFLSLDLLEGMKQESLSEAQLEFLMSEIKVAGSRPLFLFCHAPLNLGRRLDMVYYDTERSGCVDMGGEVKRALLARSAPTFWMSGHVHLHPKHYLFPPYLCGGNVWQIHCPDSWGYGRWKREQHVPQPYEGVFSRHLEIEESGVNFVTHDHVRQEDIASYRVDFGS